MHVEIDDTISCLKFVDNKDDWILYENYKRERFCIKIMIFIIGELEGIERKSEG